MLDCQSQFRNTFIIVYPRNGLCAWRRTAPRKHRRKVLVANPRRSTETRYIEIGNHCWCYCTDNTGCCSLNETLSIKIRRKWTLYRFVRLYDQTNDIKIINFVALFDISIHIISILLCNYESFCLKFAIHFMRSLFNEIYNWKNEKIIFSQNVYIYLAYCDYFNSK